MGRFTFSVGVERCSPRSAPWLARGLTEGPVSGAWHNEIFSLSIPPLIIFTPIIAKIHTFVSR